MQLIRKREGFSLTSVLVASALIGILGVVLMEMIRNAGNASSTVSRQTNYDSLMGTVNMVIGREDLCVNTFSNVSSSSVFPINLSELKLGSHAFVKAGELLGPGLRVDTLQINADPALPATDVRIASKTDAKVILEASRQVLMFTFNATVNPQASAVGGKRIFNRVIPIEFIHNKADGTLLSCSSSLITSAYFPVNLNCGEGQVLRGLGPTGPDCVMQEGGTSNVLGFTERNPTGMNPSSVSPVSCKTTNAWGMSSEMSCDAWYMRAGQGCTFESARGGWVLQNGWMTTPCLGGITYTDSTKEQIFGMQDPLPSEVNASTFNIACQNTAHTASFPAGEIQCDSLVSSKGPLTTIHTQVKGMPQGQTVCAYTNFGIGGAWTVTKGIAWGSLTLPQTVYCTKMAARAK